MTTQHYDGYLSCYLDHIRELHAAGKSTREIAEALYAMGARAATSDPKFKMTKAHHVVNLRMMVLHVLQRIGLRVRRSRVLKMRQTASGLWDL
jgi:hypothetical protein